MSYDYNKNFAVTNLFSLKNYFKQHFVTLSLMQYRYVQYAWVLQWVINNFLLQVSIGFLLSANFHRETTLARSFAIRFLASYVIIQNKESRFIENRLTVMNWSLYLHDLPLSPPASICSMCFRKVIRELHFTYKVTSGFCGQDYLVVGLLNFKVLCKNLNVF